jgi:L-malate glycosyltransferase
VPDSSPSSAGFLPQRFCKESETFKLQLRARRLEVRPMVRSGRLGNPGLATETMPPAYAAQSNGSPMMRVAICTVGELFGGVERHVLGLMEGLTERRVEVVLVLFHDGELAARARAFGVEPVILPGRNFRVVATAHSLARVLKERHIEIVHVHGYKAAVYCALARRWYRCAMVKTEHGRPEMAPGRPIESLRSWLYNLLDGWATRYANAAVCYVAEELWTYHRRAHAKLYRTLIRNGIPDIDYSRLVRPPEFLDTTFNALIVGRVDTVKGHRFAIEALASPAVPPNVHLYVVGNGPLESDLREQARAYGISERVHFLGFRRNVFDYIGHCQVLLVPSLHEGLPYTLLEAMALEAPIIASRVGGLAEVLRDEVTGLLIAPGDAHALARCIRRLCEDPGLSVRLGSASHAVQRKSYALNTMVESYLGVFQEKRDSNALNWHQPPGTR